MSRSPVSRSPVSRSLLLRPLIVCLAAGLLTLLGASAARASAPTILNYTRSAATGDVLFLQGDNFGTSPRAQFAYNSASWVNLPTLTSGNNALTARLPFLPNQTGQSVRNLITVRVYNGSAWSKSVYVNQARAFSYDTPEIASGSAFRVFGRDLFYGSQTPLVTPTVRLVDQTTQVSQTATVNTAGSSAYVLSVTAPAGIVAGDTYTVMVSNGYNGTGTSGGETTAAEPLLGRAGGADVWNLGVPWGAGLSAHSANRIDVTQSPYFADNTGAADAQPAIQQALTDASNEGGGVVYLPAGTYKLAFTYPATGGLLVWSNVVLAGAGMNQTTVQYGFPGSNGGPNYGIFLGNGWNPVSDLGIADMTLQNVDTSGRWTENVLAASNFNANYGNPNAPQVSSEVFLQRVRLQASYGGLFLEELVNKFAVENCDFELLGGAGSAWACYGPGYGYLGLTNAIFRGNTVHWSGGGAVGIEGASDVVVENNHFTRDCSPQYKTYLNQDKNADGSPGPLYGDYTEWPNTRCFDNNFDKNQEYLNNTFDVVGGQVNTMYNDGETISNEGGANERGDEDTGTATSATATTLTDTTKSWKTPTAPAKLNASMCAIIVAGTGTGEWRTITGVSPTTLTVDHAWTIIPDGTSRYALTDWSAENWLVAGNTLSNNRVGILMYFSSMHDSAFVGNTLTDNAGIEMVTAELNDGNAPGSPRFLTPMWDNQIIGNTVTDDNGGYGNYVPDPNYPGANVYDGSGQAVIGESSVELDQTSNLGTGVLGLEIRSNRVNGFGATFAQNGNPYSQPGTEGFINEYSIGSDNGTTFTDGGVPDVLGTIFQGNTAVNCNTTTNDFPYPQYRSVNGAFRVDSGVYQTVLQDNVTDASVTFLEDDVTPVGFSRGSVGTYGSLNVGVGNNWMDADIGGPSLAGSATFSNGVFTVSSAGNGLQTGASADQFNFCYQTLGMNGTIIARVVGETNTGLYGAAGVMFRHTLDPISSYFVTDLYPNYPSPGVASVLTGCRYSDGGTGNNSTLRGAVPYWIKLVRSGGTLTAFVAPDRGGVPGSWKLVNTQTPAGMPSGSAIDVGLMSQSGNSGTLNAATLDHVSVTTP